MFITNVLLKRVKSKNILVLMESVASKHKLFSVRERLGDKLEFFRFDPYVRCDCLYKELRKIKSL